MNCCRQAGIDNAKRRRRLKAGDVLVAMAGDRVAYLHYLGKHPKYGDAVLVSPGLQVRRSAVTDDIFDDGYVTFYPATAAAAQDLVEVVGHLPPPPIPDRLRRAGARSGRYVDTWIIQDGAKQVVKTELSDEELKLPIASIWNHEFLLQRVSEGWKPTQDRSKT